MPERGRGRPRSTVAQSAALAATAELLVESGYSDLTMVGVAARAGIGKQTLYRWWPSKAALVTESVLSGAVPLSPLLPVATGDPAHDLREWWQASRRRMLDEREGEVYRALSSAAATDPDVAERLAGRLGAPLESALAEVLRQGEATGAIRAAIPPRAVARLLLGALVLEILTRGRDGEAGPAGADSHDDDPVEILLLGILQSTP